MLGFGQRLLNPSFDLQGTLCILEFSLLSAGFGLSLLRLSTFVVALVELLLEVSDLAYLTFKL